jgi:GH25 family lysozyme M1 (1,4-beta-N-acetylmuramidase)
MEYRLDDNYPLWLYFNEKFKLRPSFNNTDCLFWQYNQHGKVVGISGEVDLNSFLGDYNKLRSVLIKYLHN